MNSFTNTKNQNNKRIGKVESNLSIQNIKGQKIYESKINQNGRVKKFNNRRWKRKDKKDEVEIIIKLIMAKNSSTHTNTYTQTHTHTYIINIHLSSTFTLDVHSHVGHIKERRTAWDAGGLGIHSKATTRALCKIRISG